jgi:hypothetical protein
MKLNEVIALFLCILGGSGLGALFAPYVAAYLAAHVPAAPVWQVVGMFAMAFTLLLCAAVGWVLTYFLVRPVLRLR